MAREMIIELSKIDNVFDKILRELIPSLILKLLRKSYAYINVDGQGAVVSADIETRIMGMYLEYFCHSEGVFNDKKLMKSLRGDAANKKLASDDVLIWAQFELNDNQMCSSTYSKLASHNWHLIQNAAVQGIQEIDINWDDEFSYDEFELFQYAIDLQVSSDGRIDDSGYCSEPLCKPTNFEDNFCSSFNDRNRNFSATSSDAFRVIMVVDQSGSMSSLKRQTIKSFNWFLRAQMNKTEELNRGGVPPQFTLSKFDSQQTVDSWSTITEAHRMNSYNYRPGGGTRLYDSLECIYRQFGHEKHNILMIITDGDDNMSTLTASIVKANLEKLINEKGWIANYQGANHDAKSVGLRLGIPEENCATYKANNKGLEHMYRGLNSKLSAQRLQQFMNQVAGRNQ